MQDRIHNRIILDLILPLLWLLSGSKYFHTCENTYHSSSIYMFNSTFSELVTVMRENCYKSLHSVVYNKSHLRVKWYQEAFNFE